MKKYIITVLTVLVVLALSIISLIISDYNFTANQIETLKILAIICGVAVAYCFIVGELADNYSQMDKLWSILPIAYAWVIAFRGEFKPRLIAIAIIVTLWGIRLTMNFARKGAYSLKFWTGEEDYRWRIVKSNKIFSKRIAWSMFDLFFISLYQNVLILAITLPGVAIMESDVAFSGIDALAIALASIFLIIETIADEQQWAFHKKKRQYLSEGKSLSDIPYPYSLGFNTTGLWGYLRHPNYLGEQGIWLSLYIFTIGAEVTKYGIFNWTIVGPLFLIMLFAGSSSLGEKISSGKYPSYQNYIRQVPKYIPIRKFDPNK